MILGAVAAMLLTTLTTAANTDQIDYNKYELDAPVHDMMWCGENNDVILVLTQAGSVYRSRDRGVAWKKLQSVMLKSANDVLDQDQEVRKT